MMRVFEYGKPEVQERIMFLSPAIMLILADLILYCEQNQLPCVISDAVTDLTEDQALNRVSSTHREGRAFDLSLKGWTRDQWNDCRRIMASKYRHLAAVDAQGEPNLIVVHDAGTGNHMHFQVHKRYAMTGRVFAKN